MPTCLGCSGGGIAHFSGVFRWWDCPLVWGVQVVGLPTCLGCSDGGIAHLSGVSKWWDCPLASGVQMVGLPTCLGCSDAGIVHLSGVSRRWGVLSEDSPLVFGGNVILFINILHEDSFLSAASSQSLLFTSCKIDSKDAHWDGPSQIDCALLAKANKSQFQLKAVKWPPKCNILDRLPLQGAIWL